MSETAGPVARHAWAKVNLYLEVTGRRPDGYHELQSLIVFAGVGDRLEIRPAPALTVELSGPFAPALADEADNLAARAARALAEAAGRDAVAAIRLEKNLPVAAGLGGGSADAAAVLEGLVELWGLTLEPGALERVALDLGADLPVCLFGRPALVRGIGEIVERAPPLPPAWLVLVNPGVALSTPRVFGERQGDFSPPAGWGEIAVDVAELAALLGARRNDLEPAARRLCPAVGEVLEALGGCPGTLLARMSGSGATCFALFEGPEDAEAAAEALRAARPGWWVAAAPLLHGKLDRDWRV